jgi:hypothetical protein
MRSVDWLAAAPPLPLIASRSRRRDRRRRRGEINASPTEYSQRGAVITDAVITDALITDVVIAETGIADVATTEADAVFAEARMTGRRGRPAGPRQWSLQRLCWRHTNGGDAASPPNIVDDGKPVGKIRRKSGENQVRKSGVNHA